jgi:hypothetical protein
MRILLFLLFISGAYASETVREENGNISLGIKKKWNNGWSAGLSTSGTRRFQSNEERDYNSNLYIDKKLKDTNLNIRVGFAADAFYFITNDTTKNSTDTFYSHLQWAAPLKNFKFKFRFRGEQRTKSDEDKKSYRTRYRISVSYHKYKLVPVFWNELFYNINAFDEDNGRHYDRNLSYLGIEYPMNKNWDLEFGTQYEFLPRDQRTGYYLTYVLGFTYNL